MRKRLFQLGRPILLLLAIALIMGCSREIPSPFSPIPTPSASTNVPLTPPIVAVHGKILLQISPTDSSTRATLEISDPDGSNRQTLAEVAPDTGSVVVSSNKRYIAFFTSDTASDGALIVWDIQNGETIFQMPVSAEVSGSFRDALPVRYLAWSPDDRSLVSVMNRDLHLISIAHRDVQVLVRHQEERYNLAGMVMGSIKRPIWTTNGSGIVYDTFSPPNILSAGADHYRNVEYVDVSTGVTEILLEDAHIVQRVTAPSGQVLILQHTDGRFFSLDLTTLEVEETTPLPETGGPSLCDPQNGKCVSIMSKQAERDLLRLELAPQGSQVHNVHLADLGESVSDCQFHSMLWSPDGGTLLVTVGCTGRVGLWSIRISDLEVTYLTNWVGINSVTLLSWFE